MLNDFTRDPLTSDYAAPRRRSLLLHGLGITLRRPGAVLWTYAFNLALALLFALRFGTQLGSILTHSLAGQRLTSAFDIGTAGDALIRLSDNAPSAGNTNYLGLPLYALVYFILVPGTLFCYIDGAPSRLSTLLGAGLLHFWRFIRITLLTVIVSGIVLGPLLTLQDKWSDYVDDHFTGYPALGREAAAYLLIGLVAALLRLYFDLVTAYTVQIGLQIRPDGKPDHRVRRTLLPALRVLRRNFLRTYGSFLLLSVVGLAALALGLSYSLAHLARPHVWPIFVLAQLGLFANLFARFWQRGAESILVLDNPIPPQAIPTFDPEPRIELVTEPVTEPVRQHVIDPIPDPEPASPSLAEPDQQVFLDDRPPNSSGS
ncbi:hypothetical protein FTO74_01635 [Granulicella sp. WH15]|uniref:hypothetical protein n=1 Tax=Granulicella sp. WH15 TaxID=2602070 RepID=UPI0013674316|nr:hypothetical protein [Granulicella sp. WH15]QHN02224.1 hypothetical protein FTO74_01635 [Granulicella sp. WH15]